MNLWRRGGFCVLLQQDLEVDVGVFPATRQAEVRE